jgi:hypothetical protein
MCRVQGSARLDDDERAALHCTLPGFSRARWGGTRFLRVHMGAPRRYDLEGKRDDWARPVEDIKREGCPAGWIHSRFVASLLTFYRRRDQHGGRVANPALDDCDDPLVHEAIAELEAHEDAAYADYVERRMRREEG